MFNAEYLEKSVQFNNSTCEGGKKQEDEFLSMKKRNFSTVLNSLQTEYNKKDLNNFKFRNWPNFTKQYIVEEISYVYIYEVAIK